MKKIACEICRRDFETNNPNAKYCSKECGLKAHREKDRERKIKQRAQRRAGYSGATLTEVAIAAREAGMSYGQYVGLVLHGR